MESLKYAIRCYWPIVLIVDSADNIQILNLDTQLAYEVRGSKSISIINTHINRFIRTGSIDNAFLNVIAQISPDSAKNISNQDIDADIWAHFIQDKDSKYALIKDMPRPPDIYRQIFKTLAKKRITRFDMIQAVNMPASMMSRTQYLIEDKKNYKKIALLGDDDLLIILLQNYFQVSVFDLDSELIRNLNSEKIYAVLQNFIEPFNSSYAGVYDVVFCDPPTSPAWISLFLDRAISLCRQGGLVSVACNPLGEHILHKAAEKRGLEPIYEEKIPTFYFDFRYDRMDYISMQTYFRVTDRTAPLVSIDKPHPAKILDSQNNSATTYYYDDSLKAIIAGNGGKNTGKSIKPLYPVFW